uniref:F-box domain-containing protein n=1 Tax=Chenopodium quinoa TaxID=63459 RepID=A0A803N2Y5_CHEQI
MEVAGPPHQALYFVLAYLPLQQFLQMSQLCKSLRDSIRDDVLVWLNLVVEKPLSRRLTDRILMNITSKAHGRLRTLALLNCFKITDDGLLKVVIANPLLTKKEHLLILESCITKTPENKPRFYHKYWSSSFRSIDEDARMIDVEVCPKCEEVKLVFHCPKETECIGCIQCILRCEVCGRCVSDEDEDDQGETICNDVVCLDCWLRLPKCNHCNKPFFPRHADEQLGPLGSLGFVCEVCQAKSLTQHGQE